MKTGSVRVFSLLLIFALALALSFEVRVGAVTGDENDNFGDLNDLLDTPDDKLTLKAGSALSMSDALLAGVAPDSPCSYVISSFVNENVVVCSANGIVRSADDPVCTSDVVKLLNGAGDTLDSRAISVKGDVNCDGETNTSDVTLILKYDTGAVQLDDIAFSAADVSGDGEVDSVDAVFVLRYDSGVISDL